MTIITIVDLECGSCIEQIGSIMNRDPREFEEADFLFISASPRQSLVKLSESFTPSPRFLFDQDGQWQKEFNIQNYPLTLAVNDMRIIVGMEVTSLSLDQIRNLVTSDIQQSQSGSAGALQTN